MILLTFDSVLARQANISMLYQKGYTQEVSGSYVSRLSIICILLLASLIRFQSSIPTSKSNLFL